MIRKTAVILEAAAGVILFSQISYATGGADIVDPMRRTDAAYAVDLIQRCQKHIRLAVIVR
jgi:hypothetical protein